MNFYWVYDLSSLTFFLLVISFFILFALLGTFLFSPWLKKTLTLTEETNNIVSNYFGLSGVVYGVTLGLIAVASFENFSSTDDKVEAEASSLAALYRGVNMLTGENKAPLLATLRKYTSDVINIDWPLQQKGIVPTKSTEVINNFQIQLSDYPLVTPRDEILFQEMVRQFDGFIEKRRERLNAVSTGLPSLVWLILFIGAFINIMLTWLLVIQNRKFDFVINCAMGLLLGSLIFLIAAMDNPFRGEFCVNTDAFKLLLNTLMK